MGCKNKLISLLIVFKLMNFENVAQISDVSVREADVLWSKKIWRIIERKENINTPIFYQNGTKNRNVTLFDLLKMALLRGELSAYKSDNFHLNEKPLTKLEIIESIIKTKNKSEYIINSSGDEFQMVKHSRDTLASTEILQYLTMEEWFFDKSRSVMDFRLIALAPVIYSEAEERNMPLFWLYYPHCINLFSNFNALGSVCEDKTISFDRIFRTRRYSAVIYKESNLYDREINDYQFGMDQLLESEKIKEDVIKFECDLWQW